MYSYTGSKCVSRYLSQLVRVRSIFSVPPGTPCFFEPVDTLLRVAHENLGRVMSLMFENIEHAFRTFLRIVHDNHVIAVDVGRSELPHFQIT